MSRMIQRFAHRTTSVLIHVTAPVESTTSHPFFSIYMIVPLGLCWMTAHVAHAPEGSTARFVTAVPMTEPEAFLTARATFFLILFRTSDLLW